MALFAIADLHLSLGTNKPMDVFEGWHNYVEKIETNWRKIVKDTDTVVIAGDISWAMKLEDTAKDFDFINKLPGKKIILKGNHDYWWTTKRKMDNYLDDMGFHTIKILHNSCEVVGDIAVCGTRGWMYNSSSEEDIKITKREAGRLRTSILTAIDEGKEPVVFLHYPPVYDVYISEEILNVLEEFSIKRCYFGHIHGKLASKKTTIGDYNGIKMALIACDYLNFCPLLV